MKKKKKGIISTIKRIRVRKIERKPNVNNSKNFKIKSNSYSNIRVESRNSSNDFVTNPSNDAKKIVIDEKEKKEKKDKKRNNENTSELKEKTNLINFDHKLTNFEYKLKYLNLRDLDGSDYGRYFPPIRNKIIIIDDEDRKFTAVRAGNNQITGDLLTFFKKNSIKPGDVFKFEYDPDERNEDGLHLLRLKKKE